MTNVGDLSGKVQIDTGTASGALGRLQRQVQEFTGKSEQSFGRLSQAMTLPGVAKLGAAFGVAATAASGLIHAFQSMAEGSVRASMAFEKISSTLRVATGSAAGAVAAYGDVRDTARTLGLDLKQTAESFGRLAAAARGTTLEGRGVHEIFTAMAKASAVLQMSGADTAGALRAIEQMISKGSVSSEELRGQLAERLPGALEIAARAMGVTTAQLGKMLEQGQVLTSDFLPKFAQEITRSFGDEATKASTGLQGSFNKLNTELFELGRTVGGFLATYGQPLLSWATSIVQALNSLRLPDAPTSGAGWAQEHLEAQKQRLARLKAQRAHRSTSFLAGGAAAKLDPEIAAIEQYIALVERQLNVESAAAAKSLAGRPSPAAAPMTPDQQTALGSASDLFLANVVPSDAAAAIKLQQQFDDLAVKAGPAAEQIRKMRDAVMAVRLEMQFAKNATELFGDTLQKDVAEWSGFEGGLTASTLELSRAATMAAERTDALNLEKFNQDLQASMVGWEGFEAGMVATSAEIASAKRNVALYSETLRDLEEKFADINRSQRAFGRSFDATEARIDATKDAMRALIRDGMDPAEDRIRKLRGDLEGLESLKGLESTFRDIFGGITGAFEKMATGIIQGTLTIRDAFRNMGQSIVVEIVQRVIRQALNPLIDTLAKVAAAAVNQFLPGSFVSGAGGAGGFGLSAGAVAALAAGAGVGLTAYGQISGNRDASLYGGIANVGYGAYGVYQAGLGTTTGVTATGAGISTGSQLGSMAGIGSGLGILGGALSIYGAQTGNERVMAAGQLIGVASTGLGLAAAVSAGGAAAGTGALAGAAAAGPYAAAAVLAAMSIYNATQTTGSNFKKLSKSQQTGAVVGAYASPTAFLTGLAPLRAMGVEVIPDEYAAYLDPIGSYVGQLFGTLFGGKEIPHAVREAREVSRTLGYAGGAQGDIARSRSIGELYGKLTSYGSGATGGTSPVALLPYIDTPSAYTEPTSTATPHYGKGAFGFIGKENPLYPTISLEQFRAMTRSGEIDKLKFNIQAGVTPGKLEGGNQSLAGTAVEVAKALLEVEDAFNEGMKRLETRIVPFLAGGEVSLFRDALTAVREAFDREGAEVAAQVLEQFETDNKALVDRIQAQFQSLQQGLAQALGQAFQAPTLESGLAIFADSLRQQILGAVTQGLVEGVTSSEAFQGIITPALQPIREIVGKIAMAEPSAMTADFFGERTTEIRGVLAGVAERLGPMLPILAEITGFARSLPMLGTDLLPGFAAGGIVPGLGSGDIVPALLEPGELITPRAEVPALREAVTRGRSAGRGGPSVIQVVMPNGRVLAEAVYDDMRGQGAAGRQVVPEEIVFRRRRG